MPLGVNTNLITTATGFDIAFNTTNDTYDANAIDPTGNQAVAFVFGNGTTADDTLENFDKNDSIINYKAIFDGNGDGIISFGPNGVLDIDRAGSGSKNAGEAQVTVSRSSGDVLELRSLGTKDGTAYVYADASTRLAGMIEGTVGNNTFDASTGARTYLYDTGLGLNLGGDTITGFGADDRIVTTTKIHNGPDAGAIITFGANGVLDLPGDTNGVKGDVGPAQGGQIDLGAGVSGLALLNTVVGDGVTYYYYGLPTL